MRTRVVPDDKDRAERCGEPYYEPRRPEIYQCSACNDYGTDHTLQTLFRCEFCGQLLTREDVFVGVTIPEYRQYKATGLAVIKTRPPKLPKE